MPQLLWPTRLLVLDRAVSVAFTSFMSIYVNYYNTNKIVDKSSTDYIFSPALSMITNSKCLKNVFLKTRSYISICISTPPTQYTTFISYTSDLWWTARDYWSRKITTLSLSFSLLDACKHSSIYFEILDNTH